MSYFSQFIGVMIVCMCDSWMYWTDWEEDEVNDSIGRIEKAWMDGSSRRIFVTSNMLWPNGLTLDHSTSTMYWCDAYYDHIERIYLNGTGRMVSFTMSRPCTVVKWCRNLFAGLILAVILVDLSVNLLLRFKGPESGVKENYCTIAIFFFFFFFPKFDFLYFGFHKWFATN